MENISKYIVFHVMSSKKPSLIFFLCVSFMVVIFSVSLTLGKNLKAKIMNQGTEGNMIVVDRGADTPMFSALLPETYSFIKTVPHIKSDGGGPLVSRCLMLASLISGKFTMIRGVDPVYFKLNGTYHMIEGRLPTKKNEIIIGTLLSQKVNKDFKRGDTISFEGRKWKIAGIFEDRVSVMGSGIVTRLEDLQNATNRKHISFVSLRADSPENMEAIKTYVKKTYDALLIDTPDVPGVSIDPEVEYFLHEAEAINPMVMFINMVNILFLLTGVMIMNNAGHYIFLPFGKVRVDGYGKESAATIITEILSVAVAGGIAGAVVIYLIKNVSINFMFMTFFLKSSPRIILTGILVTTLLALLSTSPIVRKVRVEKSVKFRSVKQHESVEK